MITKACPAVQLIRIGLLVSLTLALAVAPAVAEESVELIGTLSIPGNQVDKSELDQQLQPEPWHNLFGGISALEYLGQDDLYLALPDRGPKDGAVEWACRVHVVRLPVNQFLAAKSESGGDFAIERTVMLKAGARQFTGLASRYEATETIAERLDPEGIRRAQNGHFYLSDEYGPHLLEFDAAGSLHRRFNLPQRYQINIPGKTKQEENKNNDSGRQGNQGLEGLATVPDQNRLFALFQGPLLQDSSHRETGKPTGTNCRLLEFDIKQESVREFLYPLDQPGNKLNEILWVGDDSFLVIERDGKAGKKSRFKKIMQIDISKATEIQDWERLPSDTIPADIQPVAKRTLIDLLDPRFGLAGKNMPEKIEGLTFGPKLSDGRRTLLVASDNDFIVEQPTVIYCFAIGNPVSGSARASEAKPVTQPFDR